MTSIDRQLMVSRSRAASAAVPAMGRRRAGACDRARGTTRADALRTAITAARIVAADRTALLR